VKGPSARSAEAAARAAPRAGALDLEVDRRADLEVELDGSPPARTSRRPARPSRLVAPMPPRVLAFRVKRLPVQRRHR
jgi:hypothetical protein